MRDELIEEAELGEEARNFLASPLGKNIIARAEREYESALQLLAKVDPTKPDEIRKLQNQVQLFETFDEWLREIVFRGENAIEVFKHQEQENQ